MNKRILTLILIIVLFIPSFVAVGYYSSTKTGPNKVDDVTALKIEDPDGTSWSFSSDDGVAESTEMINLFFGMRTNSVEVPALPEAIAGTKFFRVTLLSFGQEEVFQYYFTKNPSEAYIVKGDGAVTKITEEDATVFLATKYSVSLYDDTSVPLLIVGGEEGTRVSPSSAVWNYKSYDGSFAPLETSPFVTSEVLTCEIEGGFNLSFTEAPDYVTLAVSDGEKEIFNDIIENMDSLSLGDAKEFTVSVSAQWFERDDKSFHGTANYTFIGNVVDPAVFYLGQTSVENGNFVVIGGKNISDPGNITFESNPTINYTPKFHSEGEYVYALVPISYELENGSAQNYTFTLTYGGVVQEMYLTVTPYKYGSSTVAISAAVESETYSESVRGEAETVLSELAKKEELTEHAFSGTFLEDVVGEGSEGKISPGFGRFITVEATGTEYRHTGIDYNVPKGTEVYSVNAGTVIYSDYLTTTGYIVVVDHGWGLKSWYCHLSECKVAVGDKVGKGDLVGLSGDTGFAAKNRTHVGLTVYDVPVCLYGLWDEAVAIPDMG